MKTWGATVLVSLAGHPQEIDRAFRREVRWQPAMRVNQDSRFVLLLLQRLLNACGWTVRELSREAIVACCQDCSMESYVAFDEALGNGQLRPAAFAAALPSIPVACAGLAMQMRGPAYTIVGGMQAGARAVEQAGLLLETETAKRVILIAWRCPADRGGQRERGQPARGIAGVLERFSGATTSTGFDPVTDVTAAASNDPFLSEILAALQRCGRAETGRDAE